MGELFSSDIKAFQAILLSDIVEINLFMPADLFVHLGEILCQDGIEAGIVAFEFFAGVYLVVLAVAIVIIDFGIDVEPVLNSFCPIFLDVGGGIDIFPAAFGDSIVEGSL